MFLERYLPDIWTSRRELFSDQKHSNLEKQICYVNVNFHFEVDCEEGL